MKSGRQEFTSLLQDTFAKCLRWQRLKRAWILQNVRHR